MSVSSDRQSRFQALPEVRCKELLASHTAGRVAWTAPDGPCVLPVNYSYRSGEIVFRTSEHGMLSTLARRTRVAFEIDEIDERAEEGWNVLVRGVAVRVTDDYEQTTLWRKGPTPWAGGPRTMFIAITPERITGRAVRGDG